MKNTLAVLLLVLAGCGAQDPPRRSSGNSDERAAQRLAIACDTPSAPRDQIESVVHLAEGMRDAGWSRSDVFGYMVSEAEREYGSGSADFIGFINCMDSLLDEVYGPN